MTDEQRRRRSENRRRRLLRAMRRDVAELREMIHKRVSKVPA